MVYEIAIPTLQSCSALYSRTFLLGMSLWSRQLSTSEWFCHADVWRFSQLSALSMGIETTNEAIFSKWSTIELALLLTVMTSQDLDLVDKSGQSWCTWLQCFRIVFQWWAPATCWSFVSWTGAREQSTWRAVWCMIWTGGLPLRPLRISKVSNFQLFSVVMCSLWIYHWDDLNGF